MVQDSIRYHSGPGWYMALELIVHLALKVLDLYLLPMWEVSGAKTH